MNFPKIQALIEAIQGVQRLREVVTKASLVDSDALFASEELSRAFNDYMTAIEQHIQKLRKEACKALTV